MANILESHRSENAILKQEILDTQLKIITLQQKVTGLEVKLERMEQLFMLSDLVCMFRFYISYKTIPDWGTFVETLLEWKADLEEGIITEDEYQNYLQPYNNLFGVEVDSLVALVQERNDCPKNYIRAAPDQDLFLAKCRDTVFCGEFQPFVNQMVLQLDSVHKVRLNKTKDGQKK